MDEINDEVHTLSNWGYKPFEGSHDGFVPNKSYQDLESKLPIMNYLKQSLSLLGNVSAPKLITKDDVETQRRPVPLHKRKEVMLRDILSANHKEEDRESPLESALIFNQVRPVPVLDTHLAAISDATKAYVERLDAVSGSGPIIIPSVEITSDCDSDTDSVSLVAFDVKNTNGDSVVDEKPPDDEIVGDKDNEISEEKDDEDYIPLDNYVEPPDPTIRQNSMNIYIPSVQRVPVQQPQEQFVMRDVTPRIKFLGASRVIRGSLGRQTRQRLTMPPEIVKVSLTTPPVFNVDNVPIRPTHVPSCNSRQFRTCEYFKHLEGKQKLLKEKREKLKMKYSVQINKEESSRSEELSIIDMKVDEPPTVTEKINTKTEHYFSRNISPQSRTLKINDIVFETDKHRKCNRRKDSDSFAIHYMTGYEMFERQLLPRPKALTKTSQRSTTGPLRTKKELVKTIRTNDCLQHKKARKYNSAPLERKARPKSTDSFWASSKQNPHVKKVISTGDVNIANTEQKIKQITKQARKSDEPSVHESNKTKLSLKRPPVTMVSLKNHTIDKTIKVTVAKNHPVAQEKKLTEKLDDLHIDKVITKNMSNSEDSKIGRDKKYRSSADSQKQVSKKVIEFPKEQLKIERGAKSPRQKPIKSRAKKRESVASSIDRFKQNEFRDIQNKLQDENIMVSVNLIEKVLFENKADKLI